jgi:hypothetical protein
MILPTPNEFSAYLAALQDHPFSALLLAVTVIACIRALKPRSRSASSESFQSSEKK